MPLCPGGKARGWWRSGWLLILALSACATPPLSAPTTSSVLTAPLEFTASGRFALRHEQGSAAGRFTWQRGPSGTSVLLSDPLGRGLAELTLGADGATLTTADQRRAHAVDADALALQMLGYPLPVNGLSAWIAATPAHPATARALRYDQMGRLQSFAEDGWRITYDYPDDNARQPRRLTAAWGEGVEVKLIIEDTP
jgi:outer membrane lipoprotein LolB